LTVTGIVDGDTVDLSDGRRVRLLGIDTPERGECGFEQASEFARTALLHRPVAVSTDPTQDAIDAHGRRLLYLSTDGQDYSTAAAAAGWAEHYVFSVPVQKAPEIAAAQAGAQRQRVGLWGMPRCQPAAAQTTAAPPRAQPATTAKTAVPQPALAPPPAPARPPTRAPKPSPQCHPSYQPCVPNGPDLDCPDIGHLVTVVGPDEYRLDADNDGTGCDAFA
jgi:endonuclease YncB( thermonuclease family)